MIKRILGLILLCLCLPFICYADGWFFASHCNPDSNEIGSRTAQSTYTDWGVDEIICVGPFQPDCTGTLGTALIKATDNGEHIKVGVFLSDGDAPDVGDTLVGSWVDITCVADTFTESASKVTGVASTASYYWIAFIPGSDTNVYRLSPGTEGGTTYYILSGFDYDSPPSTLDGTWTGPSTRDYSLYVEIE